MSMWMPNIEQLELVSVSINVYIPTPAYVFVPPSSFANTPAAL